MKSYSETWGLSGVLQRLANGVDRRISIEVEWSDREQEWGYRTRDPWGGNWFEKSYQKLKTFLLNGY